MPRGIEIQSGFGPQNGGFLYIMDENTGAGDGKGWVFDSIGNLQTTFTAPPGAPFVQPTGITLQPSTGKLFIADSFNPLVPPVLPPIIPMQIWQTNPLSNPPTPTLITTFGNTGPASQRLNGPEASFPVDSSGSLYVADSGNNRVVQFNSTVTPPTFVTDFGTFGNANNQLYNPDSLPVDPTGFMHIADQKNARVQVWDTATNTPLVPSASYVTGAGPLPAFNAPTGLSLQNATRHAYVTDINRNYVAVFDTSPLLNGPPTPPTFLTQFTIHGNAPTGGLITVDPYSGKIYFTAVETGIATPEAQIWFDPTEWTSPGTSLLPTLPLNQPLTLNNGMNLRVVVGPGPSDGNTALNAGGNLTINPGGSFNSHTLSMNGGSITDNANTTLIFPLALTNGTFNSGAGNTFTYAGNISGGGAFNVGGLGTTILSGNNIIGNITIDPNATLQGNAASLNSSAIANAGALIFNQTTDAIFGDPITGNGIFTKKGGGILQLTNAGNSFGGGIFINGGTVAANLNDQLGTLNKPISFDGGTLQFLSGMIVSRPMTLNSGGGTLSLTGHTVDFQGGVISGPGALIVSGPGTFYSSRRKHLLRRNNAS